MKVMAFWFKTIAVIVCSIILPLAAQAQGEEPSLDSSYILRPMDVILIQVFGESELNSRQRIDGNGFVRMGLVGSVPVAGLNLKQAEERIEQAFVNGRFLRFPQVSIQVETYSAQFISILGQVSRPGRLQLEEERNTIRLVDAISAMGGFTGIARGDQVRITRVVQGGEELSVVVNAAGLINGRRSDVPAEFQVLLPGDIVFVPERLF